MRRYFRVVVSATLEGRLFADWPYTVRGQRFPARLISYRRGYLALRRGQSAESIEHFKDALRHPPIIWMIDPLEDCLANAYFELGATASLNKHSLHSSGFCRSGRMQTPTLSK
jgi:hypothetical protein